MERILVVFAGLFQRLGEDVGVLDEFCARVLILLALALEKGLNRAFAPEDACTERLQRKADLLRGRKILQVVLVRKLARRWRLREAKPGRSET